METIYFEQLKINFDTVQYLGSILYRFSILDQSTGSRYDSADFYLTRAKACLAAFFLCLRASLDQNPRPALLIDLETGTILSSNLAAFELLLIDASGANITDFAIDLKHHSPTDLQAWQAEELHQLTPLCNADGLLMECEIEVQRAPHYPQWATVYLKATQSQPCFPQLSH